MLLLGEELQVVHIPDLFHHRVRISRLCGMVLPISECDLVSVSDGDLMAILQGDGARRRFRVEVLEALHPYFIAFLYEFSSRSYLLEFVASELFRHRLCAIGPKGDPDPGQEIEPLQVVRVLLPKRIRILRAELGNMLDCGARPRLIGICDFVCELLQGCLLRIFLALPDLEQLVSGCEPHLVEEEVFEERLQPLSIVGPVPQLPLLRDRLLLEPLDLVVYGLQLLRKLEGVLLDSLGHLRHGRDALALEMRLQRPEEYDV